MRRMRSFNDVVSITDTGNFRATKNARLVKYRTKICKAYNKKNHAPNRSQPLFFCGPSFSGSANLAPLDFLGFFLISVKFV